MCFLHSKNNLNGKIGHFWQSLTFLAEFATNKSDLAIFQKIAKCTISKFCQKSSKIPRLKYIKHLIEHMFRKIESLSIFGLPHVVNEPDYSSHRVLIEYRTFEQNDLSIWLFERMEVKSKKNFVQN